MARRKHQADLRPITCLVCGQVAQVRRSDARTCGPSCKKALQRAIRKDGLELTARQLCTAEMQFRRMSPLKPADDKGDTPAPGKPVIQQAWPHGTLVRYLDKTTWRPGRINWLSRAGEECTRYARHCTRLSDINNTWQVPVETLCGVESVFLWDVRKA